MAKRQNPYSLRLDPEQRLLAEKYAKRERRSLNAWIQVAVEKHIQSIQKQEEMSQ